MATTTPAGVRAHAKHGGGGGAVHGEPMSHRQIMEALTGLLLGMFVAILSSTIVSNALPDIIKDLGGGQSAYTWVVTASLLAMTASTPLWGKLADLFSKKLLIQIALVIFVLGSAAAGLSQNPATLITFRAVQGIGMGGLSALAQIILAAMISPRERGRYNGYLGATFATAMVGGPLIGGVMTDTDWLGWRWCFYVGVPFAVVALVVLQRTLHLPAVVKRRVKVDWAGAFFITAAVCLLLVWVTFAGDKYDWVSWQTYAMVGGTIGLLLVFVAVEARASEPIIPLRLFRNRTITLASLSSLFVGIAMFAGTIFFSQYFQLARNESPTMSGVLTIPMIMGLFVSSTVSGRVITRTGRWKGWLLTGGVLITAGLGLLGTIEYDTAYWRVGVFMALLGLGVGMMMQNLVLATQNQVAPGDLGAASSVVTFFRSLGGAIGVSALGAILTHRISHYVQQGAAALDPRSAAALGGASDTNGSLPDLDSLPGPIRTLLESSYGSGIADVFLYAAPVALLSLICALFIKEVPLRTQGALAQAAAENEGGLEKSLEVVAVGASGVEARPGPTSASVPSGGTPVRGFVHGAESVPVPQAAVTLISLGGRQLGRAVARSDGGYALDAPGAGSYVLIASADGFQPQASTISVDGEPVSYDIRLSGTSGLSGVVRAAVGGLPVVGAMVVVTDVRGDLLASRSSGEQGEFGFDELVPGTVTLAVNAAGFRPRALPVEIGGGVTRTEVALDAGARVRGIVRAPHGPLADARVTLVDAAGNVIRSATTGPDGAYAFTDLDGGAYTVVATGYPPSATSLTVSGQGVDDHDIDLAHPGA
ncbi:MFS transporter [Streptomyces sp. NPDC048290]|uniref:MFS transporter n=1 Tax=Streptomyces sp. NPDC048290 TaxID=3155811 RepID=UPI0034146BAE